MENKKVLAMVESAVMIALATVLSLLKLAELPAGGSVTFASMLPIVLISYRHGTKYGLAAGAVYGVIQQLLGLKNLSYVTGFASVLAVILLDYAFAFALIGLGGFWRRVAGTGRTAAVAGGITACLCRYLCHVFSGATVWAGLSIPSEEALLFSFSYNATYMLPETVITAVVLFYLTENLDFAAPSLTRRASEAQSGRSPAMKIAAGGVVVAAVIYDTLAVFSRLQASDGTFDVTLLSWGDLLWPGIVTAAAAVIALVLLLLGRKAKGKAE